MFHVLGVSLALVGAEAARLQARLNDRSRKPGLELDLPGKHIPRGRAHVGAIQVQANASDERLEVLLSEACVGTRRAALRAVVTGLDTTAENAGIDGRLSWVSLDHLLRVSHGFSFLAAHGRLRQAPRKLHLPGARAERNPSGPPTRCQRRARGYRYPSGSTGEPLTRTSKWRCGPLEKPVEPT
jgi:hypothetical protein